MLFYCIKIEKKKNFLVCSYKMATKRKSINNKKHVPSHKVKHVRKKDTHLKSNLCIQLLSKPIVYPIIYLGLLLFVYFVVPLFSNLSQWLISPAIVGIGILGPLGLIYLLLNPISTSIFTLFAILVVIVICNMVLIYVISKKIIAFCSK